MARELVPAGASEDVRRILEAQSHKEVLGLGLSVAIVTSRVRMPVIFFLETCTDFVALWLLQISHARLAGDQIRC
jgi:hypothetical protein